MNELLADVLRAYGFEPLRASSGEQALGMIESQSPDAVLLDLMLPGISGFDVCRRLKTARSTRDIPVVLLTALDRQVERRFGYESGADDYMTKPFVPDALVQRLRDCLSRRDEIRGACAAFQIVLEPVASVADLKAFNSLATCLFARSGLAPEHIEALRQGLVAIAEAAAKWSGGIGEPSPIRLTVNVDGDRLRLAFQPATERGREFLAEHLAEGAAVPTALRDAGLVDRFLHEGDSAIVEKQLPPPQA